MDSGRPQPTLERALGNLMHAGVYGSALCLFAGLVLWLFHRESAPAGALLRVGLIALMAAPGFRVLISAVEAVRLRDWVHLATILTVAGLLAIAVTTAARS